MVPSARRTTSWVFGTVREVEDDEDATVGNGDGTPWVEERVASSYDKVRPHASNKRRTGGLKTNSKLGNYRSYRVVYILCCSLRTDQVLQGRS